MGDVFYWMISVVRMESAEYSLISTRTIVMIYIYSVVVCTVEGRCL